MGWRCVVIDSPCKLSVSNNYLVVRNDDVRKIHLSEVYCLMIACPAVNITGIALYELTRNKIKVVFCDEKRDPYGELIGYYGSYNCAKQLRKQLGWSGAAMGFVGTEIVTQKIRNQAAVLRKYGFDERASMLDGYAAEVVRGDTANREGHAAKVYFNTLFGMSFTREKDCDLNSALNYGYAVLLSCINREVVACGRLTQLGLTHRNEFNEFNLSCDLIEPFRVLVDEDVFLNRDKPFGKERKFELVGLLNKRVVYGKEFCLNDAVGSYVRNVFDCLDSDGQNGLALYEFA